MILKIVSYSIRLLIICGIAGLGVSFTYTLVEEKISANAADQFNQALEEVSGGMALKKTTTEEKWDYWEGEGKLYIAEGSAQGYSSKLRVLTAVSMENPADPEVKAIKVLFQQETPGLGALVEEVESKDTIWSILGFVSQSDKTEGEKTPWFQAQFRSKKMSAVQKALKGDPGELGRHITGATISSNAVERAICVAVEQIQSILEGS